MTTNDFSKTLNRNWWAHYDETIKRLMKAKRQLEKAPEVSYQIAEMIVLIDNYIDRRIDDFQTGKILCNFPENWVPMFKESQK